jgi:transcriptional regulator with XRE-family HTH domain
MTPTQALAGEIRATMARKRLQPADMAEAIGVHRVTASAIYNGRTSIDIERLDAIAQWLGVSSADLLAASEAAIAGSTVAVAG